MVQIQLKPQILQDRFYFLISNHMEWKTITAYQEGAFSGYYGTT